jgi:hypothetical protein
MTISLKETKACLQYDAQDGYPKLHRAENYGNKFLLLVISRPCVCGSS